MATRTVATKFGSTTAHTPTRSPMKRKAQPISLAQKQALIDNLQLEITERARKLRAQYADQAHALRTRLEIRISRVPKALRELTMGELFQKHLSEISRQVGTAINDEPRVMAKIVEKPIHRPLPDPRTHGQPDRGTKRRSDDSFSSDDKENGPHDEISNPKKRTKLASSAVAPPKGLRGAGRHPETTQVLSPKSSNSQSFPKSPLRAVGSPTKSTADRPVSPLKRTADTGFTLTSLVAKAKGRQALPAKKVAATANSAAGVGRAKRGTTRSVAAKPLPMTRERDISTTSNESSKTTVKGTRARKLMEPKKLVGAAAVGASRNDTARAKTNRALDTSTMAAVRRNLRKRN